MKKLCTPVVSYMYYDLRRAGFNCENLLIMNCELIQSLLAINRKFAHNISITICLAIV